MGIKTKLLKTGRAGAAVLLTLVLIDYMTTNPKEIVLLLALSVIVVTSGVLKRISERW